MASRILHSGPPRSSSGDKKTQSALPRPSAAKYSSSSTSAGASSTSSRLPTSAGSSLFGRSRGRGKEKDKQLEKSSTTVAPVQPSKPAVADTVPSRKLSASKSRASPDGAKSSQASRQDMLKIVQPSMGATADTASALSSSERPVQPVRSLRRKPSLTGAYEKYTSSETSDAGGDNRSGSSREATTSPGGHRDPYPGAIFGITVSPPAATGTTYTPISRPDYTTPTEFQTSNSRMELYMSKQIPHKLSTQNLPPPTPNYTSTASAQDMSSASSRFTSTPSPFSRISTPNTSASSYSPNVQPTPKLTPPRQRPSGSPTRSSRPPVSLRSRKLPASTPVDASSSRGLPSVRETSTGNQSSSSSSNSTVKASEMLDAQTGIIPGKHSRLDTKPAPTAPLRLSSRRLPRPPLANAAPLRNPESDDADAASTATSDPRYQSRLPTGSNGGFRSPPPLRPSRQGTTRLSSVEQTKSPVIQSNLTHLATTGHTRRESVENAAALVDRTESASPRRKLTKTPPGNPSITSPHLFPIRGPSKVREIPSVVTDLPKVTKRDPSPVSTHSAASTRSRFGLFSRKPKVPEEPSPSVRKGPAAGTGHEGYGKLGRASRGRSGSAGSSGSRDKSASSAASERSTSAGGPSTKRRKDSFNSNDGSRANFEDDFLAQRLQPVVISGGGNIKANRNSVSMANAPMYASSSAQSSNASFASSSEGYGGKTTGVTSSQSSTSMTSTSVGDKRVSRSLLPAPKLRPSISPAGQRSLAHRRSQQRISQGDQNVRIPAPIDTAVSKTKPALDTIDTAQSSVPDPGSGLLSDDIGEGAWLRSGTTKEKSKSKPKSPRRWNLFSRARSRSPKKATPVSAAEPMPLPTPSTVADAQTPANPYDLRRAKFGGHYAMLDDEATDDEARSMDNVLRDIEDELELRDDEGAIVTGRNEEEVPQPRKVSMLLPSPPKLTGEFPRLVPTITMQDDPDQPAIERRPSRLQRVGRIPTSHTHRPSQGSFSRPFSGDDRPSLEENRPETILETEVAAAASRRPRLALQTDKLPTTTIVEQWRQATYAPAPPTNAFLHNLDGEQEFLTYPAERQVSQISGSSSSGNTSFMNMMARRPSGQGDDEVWNEYDDILANDEVPFSLHSPEGEEMLSAFPLAPVSRSPDKSPEALRSASRQSHGSRKSSSPPVPDKPDYLVVPPQLHPETNRVPGNEGASRLIGKNTLSDIYSDYNRSSMGQSRRKRASDSSNISGSRYSSQTTISSSSHVSTYTASPINQVTRAMARKTHSARDSLRFSALMTSRWLSFDRVLFSPVAEDILSLAIQAPRILILDGLANDDWSAYTALSYPNATVYNLSTTPKLRTPSPHGDEWSNPPNHKLLPLPSMAHPFPFPKGFFTAVVLRFPPLLPQHHLANIIAESKRVLRPGGFLEMTLLDIDPVNLGQKTRREVKRVKMRAQQRMPDAGLAPVADSAMKLLGRRQFEGLRHAVLGVPVATTPDASAIQSPGPLPFDDLPVSANGEDESTGANRPSRSLGDLLREAGEESGAGLAAQYPVAQTVSRVARWWWSRCYEGLASVEGNDERGTLLGLRGRGEDDSRSMWADPAVIRECQERETSLRLVLAYAVKPMVVKRRTVSM